MATPRLPKTYQAVVLNHKDDEWKLTEVPLKHPGEGQVLVKVLACGVCFADTDVQAGHMGDLFPRIPGHELVGNIVEVGQGVKNLTVGQRVGGPWHGGHDGVCPACQHGQFQICDNQLINGVSKDGGYAEYTLLQAEAVVRIPAEFEPAEVAPLLCAGVTVFNGIRKLHVEQGNLVAVQGLGGLGHLAVQYAHHMGYEVVAISSGDDKAEHAQSLGASHYINSKTQDPVQELQKLGGAAIIVQTAPNPEVIGNLVAGLRFNGKLLNLPAIGPVPVTMATLVLKGASVHGWPSGHAVDSEEAIRFAQVHGIKCLVEKYPLKDVKLAVDSLLAGKPRFRNVLVME